MYGGTLSCHRTFRSSGQVIWVNTLPETLQLEASDAPILHTMLVGSPAGLPALPIPIDVTEYSAVLVFRIFAQGS